MTPPQVRQCSMGELREYLEQAAKGRQDAA
jgi:hypothetical protein